MFSQGFNEQFADHYDFIDFVQATGLKAPQVGDAYKAFKRFSWDYILQAGLGAISECFEAWSRHRLQRQLTTLVDTVHHYHKDIEHRYHKHPHNGCLLCDIEQILES